MIIACVSNNKWEDISYRRVPHTTSAALNDSDTANVTKGSPLIAERRKRLLRVPDFLVMMFCGA